MYLERTMDTSLEPISRMNIAEMFGTTTTMMRTQEKRLADPNDFWESPSGGRPSYVNDTDLVQVGLNIIRAAASGNCLPWKRVQEQLLLAANVKSEAGGKATMDRFSRSTWTRVKARLLDLWSRLRCPISTKQKCATLEQARLAAEANAIRPFFGVIEKIASLFPEYGEANRKLNGDESPGVRQADADCRDEVATVPSLGRPRTAKSSNSCPSGVTIWTSSLASGEKGPTGVVAKGERPPGCGTGWFDGQLPPGLSKEWLDDPLNVFFAYNNESDRVDFNLFMDFLSNYMLPFHRAHVPSGPLFWLVDCKTLH